MPSRKFSVITGRQEHMKRNRKLGKTPQYREMGAGELDRIRGGAIVVSDPGGAGDAGPKVPKVPDPGHGVVVIGGDGPGGTGPN
jgi:hypothetical protein